MNVPVPASSPTIRRHASLIAALAILAITTLIYLPGLHGPFLLDDIGNLEPIKRWMDGALGWQGVVLDNRSGPTGRPLSMLSFLLDVLRTGSLDAFTFKPTNLAIHLVCGALVGVLATQVLSAAGWSAKARRWIPLAIMAIWLWMPIQVSTVLYVIQRMAQLSALWMLATLVLYLAARRRIALGVTPARLALLWIVVPLAAVAAVLSKENGALALPLAAVAEWTLFTRESRPRAIKLFLAVTVVLPTLAVLAYILYTPDFFSRGYTVRDFTFSERLLTEPRIVWDYLQTAFVPAGERMGVYHDNFPVSTAMFSPWTTALAIAAWLVVLALAWILRRKAPVFTFGALALVVSHLIESGPLALELYFEHRNYLPSVFALIALVGLGHYLFNLAPRTVYFQRATTGLVAAIALIYGLGTLNHATAWSSENTFLSLQYDYNPTSPRLLSVLTGRAIQAKDLPSALHFIDLGEHYGEASERATASLWRFIAYCEADTSVPTPLYATFERENHGRITNFAMTAWDLLANRVEQGCKGIDTLRVAHAGLAWVDASGLSPHAQPAWRTRYNIGKMVAATGDLAAAEPLVHKAWLDSDRNNGIGVLLFQLNASLGNVATCKEVVASMERAENGQDHALTNAIRSFRAALPSLEAGATH